METFKAENDKLTARVEKLTKELGEAKESKRSSAFEVSKEPTPAAVKEANENEEVDEEHAEGDIQEKIIAQYDVEV